MFLFVVPVLGKNVIDGPVLPLISALALKNSGLESFLFALNLLSHTVSLNWTHDLYILYIFLTICKRDLDL